MPRITKAKVNFISLCPRGANRLPVMYKEDGAFDFDTIVKAADNFDEKGELLAVVYSPELRDSQGEIADADVIRDAAYSFAKEGKGIDIRHNEVTLGKDKVFVAETFIVQKADARFADFKDYSGKQVDVTGGWAVVLKVEDAELRAKYRKGEWNGVSMGGVAQRKVEKTGGGKYKKIVKALLAGMLPGVSNKDEVDMTPEEMKTLFKEQTTAITAAITAALKPSEGTAAGSGTPANKEGDKAPPEFKGDPLNKADVESHMKALNAYALKKNVNWADPEAIKKYHADLVAASGDNGQSKDSPEVADLKKQLAEAQKRSNQGTGGEGGGTGGGDNGNAFSGFSKEDGDLYAVGSRMAKAANERRYGVAATK